MRRGLYHSPIRTGNRRARPAPVRYTAAPAMPPPRRPGDDPDHVYEVQDLRVRRWVRTRFDRMRFARRVLDDLRPPFVDVMLYESRDQLRVERGRAWRAPPGFLWASVGVPSGATREEIVLALVDVAGLDPDPVLVAWLLRPDEVFDT